MRFHSRVPHDRAGRSLVHYLAARFTYHDTARWTELIECQRVLLNGRPCRPDSVVRAGDDVAYLPEPFTEPPANTAFRIVYQDEWIVGVDKPSNLLVHRAGRSFTSNLIYLLRNGEQGKAWPNATAVNRLDRLTSGVVIIATRGEHCIAFADALQSKDARKEYCAIVYGLFDPACESIDAPIGKDPQSPLAYRHAIRNEGGKNALTHIIGVEHLAGRFSIVRLMPVTGRTHQLRLHCAHVGHPVVGDPLYAPDHTEAPSPSAGDTVPFGRQALHCERVALKHPFLDKRVTIEAPVPDDMRALVRELRQGA